MKKWVKNFLLIIIIAFSFGTISAQNNVTISSSSYNTWVLSNNTCYGCGSFYVMIVNNPIPENGYYYYDIYFWSNSFYSNGYAANTYIKPVNIYVIDRWGKDVLVLTIPYAVVAPKSINFNGYFYVGYVYSTNPTQKIKINWSNVSAW